MDITNSLLYYNSIQNTSSSQTSSTASALKTATENGTLTTSDLGDLSTSFSSLLNSEISDLSENQNLINALDGSVVSGLTDLSDLSTDMLKTSSGQKVLSELMNGQFASIVASDSSKDDNSKSVAQQILESDNSSSDSELTQLLSKMESLLSTTTTGTESK